MNNYSFRNSLYFDVYILVFWILLIHSISFDFSGIPVLSSPLILIAFIQCKINHYHTKHEKYVRIIVLFGKNQFWFFFYLFLFY